MFWLPLCLIRDHLPPLLEELPTLRRGRPGQANFINLLDDALCLQEEMNNAMVHLLYTRVAIDTHCQWVLLETEVSHHQKEIDTSEANRERPGMLPQLETLRPPTGPP